MGRHSTGAMVTDECMPIEMSFLSKNGYIQKDATVYKKIFWTEPGTDATTFVMSVYSDFTGAEKYIRLSYELRSRNTGEIVCYDYQIFVDAVPSNLGRGELLYFLCPETGQRCRILYRAYDSNIWKSRHAYNPRIYYILQKFSKNYRIPAKFWMLNDECTALTQKRRTDTYKGKKTARAIKTIRLQEEIIDAYMLMGIPPGLPKNSMFTG